MALIDKKLTDLTEKLSVPDDAFIHIVDVSDTSQSPEGSSYKARKSTISGTVKAQTGVSGTVKTNTNSADPIVYLKSEVDSLIIGKQNELGFTPENVSNKQNNLDEDLTNQKYPNVTAVRLGLSDKASLADLFLKADKSNTYTKAEVDNIISSLDVQDVIEADSFALLPLVGESEKIYVTLDTNLIYRFNGTIYVPLSAELSIKENTANKQNSLVADGTGVKFPTVDAVNKAVTFVTPELFGAVGDGITDDKTAIQNALNSGKTVFFANKRYYISGSLTVPAGATINGSGTGTATNILITANEPAFIINGNNITIQSLSILGSNPISNPNQHGISLIGSSSLTSSFERILISNCAFYDLGGAGFYSRTNGSTNFSSAQISNSYAYQCRIGFWFDDRAEYNNLSNIKAHKNGTGIILKGGNNLITGLISTYNDVNVKLEGSLNDGHTSISGGEINHANTYNVFSDGLTLGYTFNSCAFYAGDILIKDSKGVRFLNSEIGATNNIYFQNSTESSFTNVAFLANPAFYLKWNGTNNTGVESEVKFFNNNFWAGTPSSVINNEISDGLVVSSGDIKAYEGQKIGFRYSSGTPIFANYMTTSEANPFSFFGLWTSTPSTEMFNFNTNLGKIVSIFNNGDFKINGSYQSNTLAGTGTRLVNASPTGQLGAISTLPVFADNTAAIAGGLGVGSLYRTVIGLLAIVF